MYPIRIATVLLALAASPAIAEDAKQQKSDGKIIPSDCIQLSSLYRNNMRDVGRLVEKLAAVQDSIVRHNTQQRLLWMAWALRCDLRSFIDTELEAAAGVR